jgi:hypothetical protein
MTTAQFPAHISSPLRRSVVLPVAQARSPQRSPQIVRTSSVRVDQSGALPSSGLSSAEGRVRASALT